MRIRFVRSEVGERGSISFYRVCYSYIKDFGFFFESNGEIVMNFKRLSDLIRFLFLYFRKISLVVVWRIGWMKVRLEEGRSVGGIFRVLRGG